MKNRLVTWLIASLAIGLLSACSKTVTWEEEVPLNTGEIIWVERSVEYSIQGDAGNPFSLLWRTSGPSLMKFALNNKTYNFSSLGNIQMLAISPLGEPAIFGIADQWSWQANYPCSIPFYVQYVPSDTGELSKWLPRVEAWSLNMKTNLLLKIPDPSSKKSRYTTSDKMIVNASVQAGDSFRQKIDPNYSGADGQCK